MRGRLWCGQADHRHRCYAEWGRQLLNSVKFKDRYEPVTCLACKRLHLVNRRTGEILGQDEAAAISARPIFLCLTSTEALTSATELAVIL